MIRSARRAVLCALTATSLAASGCASAPSPSASPSVRTVTIPPSPSASANTAAIAAFWKWFGENGERLSHITDKPDTLAPEIGTHLRAINPGLTFEVGPGPTFMVSADGDTTLFPLVEEVVKAAPSIAGWKVVAFRQRRGKVDAMKYQGATVSEVWYSAEPIPPRLSIHLYVKGLTQQNKESVGGAALLLMEGTVGEYDAFTVVSLEDMDPLPADPRKAKLRPIAELPAAVDAFKATLAPAQ